MRPLPNSIQASATLYNNVMVSSITYETCESFSNCPGLNIGPRVLGIEMCDGLGVIQDDLLTPQGRRNRVYRSIFLHPCFVYGPRVIGVEDTLADTIKEAFAGRSPELCGADLPTGCADPSKEGPDSCASDDSIERIPLIGTNVGQNRVQDLRRRPSCGQQNTERHSGRIVR